MCGGSESGGCRSVVSGDGECGGSECGGCRSVMSGDGECGGGVLQ